MKIRDWETLVLESNYSSARTHTGVMGLFYILVADRLPDNNKYLATQGTVQVMFLLVAYLENKSVVADTKPPRDEGAKAPSQLLTLCNFNPKKCKKKSI